MLIGNDNQIVATEFVENVDTYTINGIEYPKNTLIKLDVIVPDGFGIGDKYINGIFEAYVEPPIAVVVPQEITRRQAKLALNHAGLLATVETAIANSADNVLKIEWADAGVFRRNWSNLIALAADLGITNQQLDDLFVLGETF